MSNSYPFHGVDVVRSSADMLDKDDVVRLLSEGNVLETRGGTASILGAGTGRQVLGVCDIRVAHQLLDQGNLERIGFGDGTGIVVNKYRLKRNSDSVSKDDTVGVTCTQVRDKLGEVV